MFYPFFIRILVTFLLLLLAQVPVFAQQASIMGNVTSEGNAIDNVQLLLKTQTLNTKTDSAGHFLFSSLSSGKFELKVSKVGYASQTIHIKLDENEIKKLDILLQKNEQALNEIVITGTMKEVKRVESPVPVEVYSAAFFKKNPTPSLFDAMQNMNGVRPSVNCNVCNTGDIRINGMEGPYTMVLIDGMPIVSSLGSVYGLFGIPNHLIERVEVVKGPASTLYGSEAVGGLINVITKKVGKKNTFAFDAMTTSWLETNIDASSTIRVNSKISTLLGANLFQYSSPKDVNKDLFTDIALQKRFTIFNTWSVQRKFNRPFTIAVRYLNEDRWGGEMRWKASDKGSDQIYGESIQTNRTEFLLHYQLPLKEKISFSASLNQHHQMSYYGKVSYIALQRIGFAQLSWHKSLLSHELLAGTAYRLTFYDDNTPATQQIINQVPLNKASIVSLPGIFIQDEWSLHKKHKLLVGLRYDYQSIHGSVWTPRIAYKWNPNPKHIVRLNMGTGYRVVNLFTEDHAALTGARDVVIMNTLKPEKSYNLNLNYLRKIFMHEGHYLQFETSAWYTYFSNRIIPNYDINPNQIIYNNLDGHAISKGISFNADLSFDNGLKFLLGATMQDVSLHEQSIKTRQLMTEQYSGTWTISYSFNKKPISIDYTGNLYGPMRLPLLSALDPRRAYSPVWSIQNIQLTYRIGQQWSIYTGVKNCLNWTPAKGNPFIIARSHDPFDKNVQFGPDGSVIPTADNPYALTFDPTYGYASNQGRRVFLGVRFTTR